MPRDMLIHKLNIDTELGLKILQMLMTDKKYINDTGYPLHTAEHYKRLISRPGVQPCEELKKHVNRVVKEYENLYR